MEHIEIRASVAQYVVQYAGLDARALTHVPSPGDDGETCVAFRLRDRSDFHRVLTVLGAVEGSIWHSLRLAERAVFDESRMLVYFTRTFLL
jgi:hypothetical protein